MSAAGQPASPQSDAADPGWTMLSPAESQPAQLSQLARSAWTVFRFEFGRSGTLKRSLIWLAVAAFPTLIFGMMRWTAGSLPGPAWTWLLFIMVVEMVVLLNALLWVAPLVQAELEGKTWLYVVTRPFGRYALVLGKGMNGLAWTLGAGWCALLGALLVSSLRATESVNTPHFGPGIAMTTGVTAPLQIGGVMLALTALSSLAYCSLFSAIGCMFPKRAMLIAFSYTLVGELLVGMMPAIVNRLTVQYHLRCLLTDWVGFEISPEGRTFLFSEWSPTTHVLWIVCMAAIWQAVALVTVHFRQYVVSDES
ncbi:MAG: hypothetical protein KF774_08725 [Planctomyces sp.]|nr:hypothetical protein [Planctomyces sp.]